MAPEYAGELIGAAVVALLGLGGLSWQLRRESQRDFLGHVNQARTRVLEVIGRTLRALDEKRSPDYRGEPFGSTDLIEVRIAVANLRMWLSESRLASGSLRRSELSAAKARAWETELEMLGREVTNRTTPSIRNSLHDLALKISSERDK